MPTAQGCLSREAAARVYFSTSSGDQLRNHFSEDPQNARLARSTSMKGVLVPPASWTPSQAESKRSMVTSYSSEYVRMPMDALPVTRELSQLYAVQGKEGQGRQKGLPVPLSSETTSKSTYVMPELTAGSGPGASCKPIQECHVDPSSHLLEVTSVSSRDFKAYDPKMIQLGRAVPAKPSKPAVQVECCFEGRSSYDREFNYHGKLKQSQSVGSNVAKAARVAALDAALEMLKAGHQDRSKG